MECKRSSKGRLGRAEDLADSERMQFSAKSATRAGVYLPQRSVLTISRFAALSSSCPGSLSPPGSTTSVDSAIGGHRFGGEVASYANETFFRWDGYGDSGESDQWQGRW